MKVSIFITLVIFLIPILTLRFLFYSSSKLQYSDGETVFITHTLLSDPQDYGDVYRVRKGDVFIYIEKDTPLTYGSVLHVRGQVEESFDRVQINATQVEVQPGNIVFRVLSYFRSHVREAFDRYLPTESSALLLGVVFGIRSSISPDFYQALIDTGMLHVVAASGSNVSLVGGFAMLASLRFARRQISLIITVGVICLYALMAGADASLIRASIMGGFSYGAQIIGRQYHALTALFLTCAVMLFIQPMLYQDVGFLLSVSSTFGIIAFSRMFRFDAVPSFVREDISTTLSAQVGNVGVLLYFFGQFPIISFVVNILLLWTVPFLLLFGALAAVVSLVHPLISAPFLFVSYPLLVFFEETIFFFADKSFLIHFDNVSVYFIFAYYIMLIFYVFRNRDET